MSEPGSATVSVSTDDLELFSRASHDRNPLHLSSAYARRTPFGQPVVFGILGALACLGRLPERPGLQASAVTLEFANPLFVGIAYTLTVAEDSSSRVRLTLRDGRRLILKLNITFGNRRSQSRPVFLGTAPTVRARDLTKADMGDPTQVTGEWGPDERGFSELVERFRLRDKGLDELQLSALIWSSYLVGMELPGTRALFSRVALTFEADATSEGLLQYQATVQEVHDQFALLTADVRLTVAGQPFARGQVEAFIREDAPSVANAGTALATDDGLAGTTTLMIGASRGLGAALTHSLAARGATVLANYMTSAREAEELKASHRGNGRIQLEQGDASSSAWCQQLRDRLEPAHLDVLVCNACPPILPLWIEGATVGRIHDHINQAIALVLNPMAAFLALVAKRHGWCVLISSSAVTDPVAEWPHYVSAKAALEALVRVAALQYPAVSFLVARPPRLRTDLTNTPAGGVGLAPSTVASVIANAIRIPTPTASRGRVEYLDTFPV
jgi:NAD(P)-dependent dehydrogenase (short-subunit alcohol dehydrogenase family)